MSAKSEAWPVLFLSNSPWKPRPFVVGSHHLAETLAAFDSPVFEVDYVSRAVTPAHLGTRRNLSLARLRSAAWGLKGRPVRYAAAFSVLPYRIARPADKRSWLFRPRVRGLRDHYHLVVVDQPALLPLLDDLRADTVIYRPTDLLSEMSTVRWIDALERDAAARADAIVATSQPVLDRIRSFGLGPVPERLIENGVDFEFFAAAARSPYPKRPTAVYVGAIDERLDVSLLTEVAALLPNVAFRVYGPRPMKKLPWRKNLEFPGPVPYKELPELMAHATVGLLPLSIHPANEGRSPMKIFEYLAAGLPVVATGTSELRRRQLEHVHLTGRDPSQVAAAISAASRPDVDRTKISATASAHDWTAKAAELLRLVEEVGAAGREHRHG